MIALGTFLATGSLSLLMLGLGYLGSDLIRSKEEEALLYQKFGHEYARYRKRVGGFIPMALQHSILVFIIFCNLIGIIDGFIFSLSGYSFTIQVLSSWLPP